MTTQLIAMHGWAGDHRGWQPWNDLASTRGWRFSSGERGYGRQLLHTPTWEPDASQRVVLAHSLGPHLLPAALLERATTVVLLASFGQFLPPGRAGRRLSKALEAMASKLESGQMEPMLREFFQQVAAPHPVGHLPPGPLNDGIPAEGCQRLLADLALLEATGGLPPGFPSEARVLVVEADDDQIVDPASRTLLRAALPQATVWQRQGAGHALLLPELPAAVLDWVAHAYP
jgi:pimeloyl-[acyl-carrier protein] methyl ester esterase